MAYSDSSGQAKFGSVVLHSRNQFAPSYALPMGFGARLAAARKQLGMTQAELGQGLGTDGVDVGKQVVYGWEKDQHYPRVDQLALICKRLRISADWLLFGDEAAGARREYKLAQAAVSQLSDEERLALFTAIQQPGALDHEVERRIPATKAKPATAADEVIRRAIDRTKGGKTPKRKAA